VNRELGADGSACPVSARSLSKCVEKLSEKPHELANLLAISRLIAT
jgi:hypothetical protein